jgi:hypothetical protein
VLLILVMFPGTDVVSGVEKREAEAYLDDAGGLIEESEPSALYRQRRQAAD